MNTGRFFMSGLSYLVPRNIVPYYNVVQLHSLQVFAGIEPIP